METVLALSIAAVIAVFTAGFLHPQMKLYYEFDRISQAKAMSGEAYRKLEEELRYGYMFFCDSSDTAELAYYVRRAEGLPKVLDQGDTCYETLPPVERWPRISAKDLDVKEMGGMILELDFSGTESMQARVAIRIRADGDVVYEQEAVISSMYSYTIDKEDAI